MADFVKALNFILDNEGGFSNNPNDPGGATNFGISLRYLHSLGEFGDFDGDGDVDIEDIRMIDKKIASSIYKKEWWDRFHYDFIKDEKVAIKLLDFSVNMGAKRAHILLQRAVNVMSSKAILKEDGILGAKTIAAVNRLDPHSVLAVLMGEAASFYLGLVEKNQSFYGFIAGWLRRAFRTIND